MEQIRVKYVFLGNEGIGKTSLIVRYTKGIFLQYSEYIYVPLMQNL